MKAQCWCCMGWVKRVLPLGLAPCTPVPPGAKCRTNGGCICGCNQCSLHPGPGITPLRLQRAPFSGKATTPFPRRARCRTPLATACLCALSCAGPLSMRALRVWSPFQILTCGLAAMGLLDDCLSVLWRLFIQRIQLDATSTSLREMLVQALAAVAGAIWHASAAPCAVVNANLQSWGACNPLACSHAWNSDSASPEAVPMDVGTRCLS